MVTLPFVEIAELLYVGIFPKLSIMTKKSFGITGNAIFAIRKSKARGFG